MVIKLNNLTCIKACIPAVVLVAFSLSICSCWDNTADSNVVGEGDVAYGNEELIPETTSMLGNSKESPKIITNLKAVKGETLNGNFSFIESVFQSKNPEFVKSMLCDGGNLKNGLDKGCVFKVNDGTTIFDLYLNNVIGDNNEANNRTLDKGVRDKWSKDSGLLILFMKSMMEQKEGLNTTSSTAGKPMLLHYCERVTAGKWHHAFDELMKIFDNIAKVNELPSYIPLIYYISTVPENDKVSAGWDSFWGKDYRERWGTYVLKIINKIEKAGTTYLKDSNEEEAKKYTLSNKDELHKAYINFIKDDWTQRIGGTTVVSRLTTVFGKNAIPNTVKPLYTTFLPTMVKTKDSKTYAASYEYIISSLEAEACNPKTISAAIQSKKSDILKKLLSQSTETTIVSSMNSPEYDGCANLIDFYAESKYFPGKSKYEEFLNMLKKRLDTPSYKNALAAAHAKCVDERSSKEATKCIFDAIANADKPVDSNTP